MTRTRPCPCDGPDCRFCRLWRHHERIRAHKPGDPVPVPEGMPPPSPPVRLGDCHHLGTSPLSRADAAGRETGCQGQWLFPCDVHGECRVNQAWTGANCQTCPDYASRAAPPPDPSAEVGSTRHLLYHIMPVRDRGTWQRNLDQLIPRMGLFNGKRVVSVATEEEGCVTPLDPPEAVEEYLRGCGCEFVRVTNSRTLREVVSWEPLWPRVPDGPGDVTFFAHAKGVTRAYDPGNSCHPWASILYTTGLDFWPVVQEQLRQYPVACSMKKVGRGFQDCPSSWHPSGTFIWVRNRDFFARPWRSSVPARWWGAEAVWGILYRPEECGVVFHTAPQPVLNMYHFPYLTNTVMPELERWRAENAHHLRHWPAGGIVSAGANN